MTDKTQNGTKGGATFADKFAAVWLGVLALFIVGGLLGGAFLLLTGQIRFSFQVTGSLPVSQVYGTAEMVFLLITALAVIELFGKDKVRALLDKWGGGNE
jgi:hypothetical protein